MSNTRSSGMGARPRAVAIWRRLSTLVLLGGVAALGLSLVLNAALGGDGDDSTETGKRPGDLVDEDGNRLEATPTPTAPVGGVGSEAVAAESLLNEAAAAAGDTGRAAMSEVLAALAGGNSAAVLQRITWTSAGCVVPGGGHGNGSPVCGTGEPPGTAVEYLPYSDLTLNGGFTKAALPAALTAVLDGNPGELQLAGRIGDGLWYLVYELRETRVAPVEAQWSPPSRWLYVELDPALAAPVVALAWSDTSPLSMYRLWDPALASAVLIHPDAVAEEQASHNRTSEGVRGPIPTVSRGK